MMGECKNIDWEDMASAIPAFLTIVMMPLTYSITNGIVFGLVSALGFYITTGRAFSDIKCYLQGRSYSHSYDEIDKDSVSPLPGKFSKTSPKDKARSRSSSFGDDRLIVRRPSFYATNEDNSKVDEYARQYEGIKN